MKSIASSLGFLLVFLHFSAVINPKPGWASYHYGIETNIKPVIKPTPTTLEATFDRGNISDIVPKIEETWNAQYEDYFRTSFPDRAITVDNVIKTLERITTTTQTKPALLYVVPMEEELELVLVTPDSTPIRKRVLGVNRQALLKQVQELRVSLTKPTLRKSTQYLVPAQQLHNWMIAPVETELKSKKINTILFCLGTGLRTLPLGVLHDGKQFLVEKYSFSRIPAFKLTDTIYGDLKNSRILAMGASEFATQNPLPAVPVELSAITKDLSQSKFFLNQEFTIANLQSQRASQPFKIIHLATHADFQPGEPSNSYIQFWDSKLTLDKISQLGWNNPQIELLVLSACKTAIGDKQAELGFAGLAVQSGVKSVIASLWSVSDEGTLGLMTEFYQQLQTAPIKAEALRQAQIAMLKGQVWVEGGQLLTPKGNISLPPELAALQNENFSHPYYWAAFTVVGSPW